MDFAMTGPAIVLGLGSIGSAIGCAIGWMVCHGVMSRVEEGHGKFIGMASMPSSQVIYSFVLMLLMRNSIEAGKLSAMNAIAIGTSVGLAILFSAVYQGMCAATAIQATAKQPAIFGKAFAALGIVESFSLFAFVFGLLLI